MKINFTKKEFRQLVTMIEIADWILHSHYAVEREDTEEYRTLRRKILSFTKEMGMEDCYQKEGDEYYETSEYEENADHTRFIDEYNETNFWEELISRLSDRDYRNQYGNEEVDFEVWAKRFTEIEHRNADEIEKSGLANLFISDEKNPSNLH